MRAVHVGIDDTDSRDGLCTTYLSVVMIDRLLDSGVRLADYPNLVRLNPNIPWKTRGNGAVALRIVTENPEASFALAADILDQVTAGLVKCHPGLVMLPSKTIPEEIRDFSRRALSNVLSLKEASELIRRHGLRSHFRGTGLGLLGALAALGNTLEGDHTFELIAYRVRDNWGSPRRVDAASVVEMSRKTFPYTFNNFDEETGRILVTPHGSDPILLGIRGESPNIVLESFSMLRIEEPVSSYVVFKSNQGTGAHLKQRLDTSAKAYYTGCLLATVASKPVTEKGGHVYFKVHDDHGELWCAAYEPTGGFRRFVRALVPGDEVEIGGGIRRSTQRHPRILNVEYVSVKKLADDIELVNPSCPKCGKVMSSEGRGKGFQCSRCKTRNRTCMKTLVSRHRFVGTGLLIPPPRAHRHLTKPAHRFGLKRSLLKERMIEKWFWSGPSLKFDLESLISEVIKHPSKL